MASVLLRLEGSVAAAARLPLHLRPICTGLFRSPNSFSDTYYINPRARARAHHTMNSSSSPRLMLPPVFESPHKINYQSYNLSNNSVESLTTEQQEEEEIEFPGLKIVGSSHGWLALFNSNNSNIHLSNPLTRQHINLPPLSHILSQDQKQVEEVEQGSTVWKLILSHSPDDNEESCRAMMSFGPHRGNNLAFCTINTTTITAHWTLIGHLDDDDEGEQVYPHHDIIEFHEEPCYHDFVYFPTRKLFFSITESNELKAWDLQDPCSPKNVLSDFTGELNSGEDKQLHDILHISEYRPEYWFQSHLVIDDRSDQLFAVTRYFMARVGPDGGYVMPLYFGFRRGWDDSDPYQTIGFDVNKIEWDESSGEIMKTTYLEDSLDGLAMFVGLNHSFALPADEFPGLKPNSVYFTDLFSDFAPGRRACWGHNGELPPPRWTDGSIYGGHDIGIFDYERRAFSPCYYPRDVRSVKRIMPPPIWFTLPRLI